MGVWASKTLLPLSLSFVSGLTSALINYKVLLPESEFIGQLVVALTAAVLPLYAAVIAATFQALGNTLLVPTNVCLLLATGMFCVCYRWFVRPSDGATIRKNMYKLRALQIIALAAAVIWAVMFVYSDSRLFDYLDYSPLAKCVGD
mmetsp:Transcript_48938/g.156695  ORF Transcript_48938/g.156695 Transcript_48938/m.156695 type:complete len:146 (-) Transcript_48938:68-505(-)